MKVLYALTLLPMLSACGEHISGNRNEVAGLLADELADGFSIAGPVVNACASNYYTELAGLYDGEIEYTNDDDTLSCTWDVDLQITSEYRRDPVNRTVCDLSMNMFSTSENPEGCSDVGVFGDIVEPLSAASDSTLWTSPPFPIEADAVLDFGLSDNTVFPIGTEDSSSFITFRFDGLGNVTYPDSFEGDFSGVLVKQ